jgi:hypothetical protein
LGWSNINKAAGEAGDTTINAVESARSVAIELDVGDGEVILDPLDGAIDGEDLGEAGVGSGLELDVDVLDVAGLVLECLVGEGGGRGGEGSEEKDSNGGDTEGLHFRFLGGGCVMLGATSGMFGRLFGLL